MTHRVYNFSPGPAVLPEPVLAEVQRDFMALPGVGASIVTPLGPLGIDLGYGLDRVDQFGHKDPKWQVHFKFGQIF